jgi:hypothetical protein
MKFNNPIAPRATTFVAMCLVSAAAMAYPVYGWQYEYFSDNTFSESVGTDELTCDGDRIKTGIVTPYRQGEKFKCTEWIDPIP